MKNRPSLRIVIILPAFLALLAIGSVLGAPRVIPGTTDATVLDDYVHKPDDSFTYTDLNAPFTGDGFTAHVLNVTSQTWLSPTDFSGKFGNVWWHYVVVVVPDNLTLQDKAFVYITGNDNTDTPPDNAKDEEILLVAALALATKSVTVVLYQIPNQPIVYTADPLQKKRGEDANIAFTWRHFHDHPDQPEWLLRLPMTKAVVKTMDAVEMYINKTKGNNIQHWAVAGASKRGWTTWTTAAVDTRVICIAPIVLDALNLHANLHHMWRAFGGWTFAFKDYYAENFTQVLDDNATLEMFSIVDPYAYKDRFATIPKLVIDAGGDEFLMVDDNHYWYAEMPGETHLLMVQDADHGMSTGLEQLVPSLVSFLQAVYLDTPRPQMSWKFGPYPGGGNGNSITLTTSEVPLKVETWHADTLSKTRRDWRLATGETPCPTKIIPSPGGDACLQPVLWLPSVATKLNDTTYRASFNTPDLGGWRAYFLVATFKGPTPDANFKFTTQVSVVPDQFPFEDCAGAACRGTLV